MPFTRDPVSELFDAGARRLLDRAYAHPGEWAATRLANPAGRHETWAGARGIDLLGPDPVPGHAARSRWARAFVRALHYQHLWWSAGGGPGWRRKKRTTARESGALVVEVGRALPGGRMRGSALPPGRAVRVKVERGGQAAVAAVHKMPDSRRYFTDAGGHAARATDSTDREWEK
jgi:hypothetical protein